MMSQSTSIFTVTLDFVSLNYLIHVLFFLRSLVKKIEIDEL